MKKFRCKLKDLIHDLKELDAKIISLNTDGVGYAIAEKLKKEGILVEELK